MTSFDQSVHTFKADGDLPPAWPCDCQCTAGWGQSRCRSTPTGQLLGSKVFKQKGKQNTYNQMITWTPSNLKQFNKHPWKKEMMNVTFRRSETYMKRKCVHRAVRGEF